MEGNPGLKANNVLVGQMLKNDRNGERVQLPGGPVVEDTYKIVEKLLFQPLKVLRQRGDLVKLGERRVASGHGRVRYRLRLDLRCDQRAPELLQDARL